VRFKGDPKLKARVFTAITALLLASTFTTASVASANDAQQAIPPPIKITEHESAFAFIDELNGRPLEIIRSLGDLNNNGVALARTGQDVPVIVHTLASLQDSIDFETWREEARVFASTEREPVFADVPEGESTNANYEYLAEDISFDSALLRPRAAFAVSPTSATFNLSHSRSYEQQTFGYYALYLDKKLVDVFNTPSFTIEGLAPSSTYSYEIVASMGDPRHENPESGSVNAVNRAVIIETPPATLKETVAGNMVTNGWVPTVQGYLHMTFIPDAITTLDPPDSGGCGAWPWQILQFGGDDRTFQFPTTTHPLAGAPSHRTYMMVEVVWNMGLMNPSKGVSPTEKFLDGVSQGYRTASDGWMIFTNPAMDSYYAQATLEHAATNPWCAAGAITYSEQARFYNLANMVETAGETFPVPNHEISFKFSSPAAPGWYWYPAVWIPLQGFHCLLGGCTNVSYYESLTGI